MADHVAHLEPLFLVLVAMETKLEERIMVEILLSTFSRDDSNTPILSSVNTLPESRAAWYNVISIFVEDCSRLKLVSKTTYKVTDRNILLGTVTGGREAMNKGQ